MQAWRRIRAISRKEFLHISRDWRTIGAVAILPLFQLLLFAYAVGFDVRNVPTVVYDADRTQASRAYIQAAENTGFFGVNAYVQSYSAVDQAFNKGLARAAIVVPVGFGQKLAAGERGNATVLVDGSEPNSADLGRTYAAALNNVYGQQVLTQWSAARGAVLRFGLLQPRVRTWYNPDHSSAYFLVPGLMVVIIMIVTIQQTAVTLVRERDSGTLEQLLVSPLRQIELVLGKVLPWAFLGFLDTALITAVSLLVFQIPLRGSVGVLAVGMFLFVLCSLSIGLVVSAIAPSMESANLIGLLIAFLPGFMLSGMAFRLASIPPVLQGISYLFPGRYMVNVSRGVFLRGAGWPALWTEIVALTVYAIIGLLLATLLNRRRAT